VPDIVFPATCTSFVFQRKKRSKTHCVTDIKREVT
jgi:hypothetical protein